MSEYREPPAFNVPPIIVWLILATVGVHAMRFVISPGAEAALFMKLAFIPARYSVEGGLGVDPAATLVSPLGYMLLHAGLAHLLVNMAMLLAFGSAVARRMSPGWFLALYALSGLAGALTVQIYDPTSIAPVIGASGAVSGIVGAVGMVAFRRPVHAPPPPRPFNHRGTAASFILLWLGINVLFGLLPGSAFGLEGRIAWEAHLGGFAAGLLLMPWLDGRGVFR